MCSPRFPLRLCVSASFLILLFSTACRQDMQDQPKYIALRPSSFFTDGRSGRPPVSKPLDTFPFPVTKAVIERGRTRFNIFCTPCHDRTGNAQGMIVRRGYRKPPSYHIDRLRQVPHGYIFDVITNGFGAMPDYAAQIPPNDRWAIVAYVRALQLSQNAGVNDVPPEARAQLNGGPAR